MYAIPTQYLSCGKERRRVGVHKKQLSNTRDFREEGCEKIALPHAPKLPLLSDLPNFDFTGL